jgi:hypothetical protein
MPDLAMIHTRTKRSQALSIRRFAFAALMAGLGATGGADAAAPGLTTYSSTLHRGTPGQRSALIIVPASASVSSRAAVAQADEEAYRKRLQEVGFDVSVIGPSDRPELDRLLRDTAARVPTGAEVAVFVLGTALSDGEDIRITPTDAPADLTQQPELLETETVRLGEVLRRLSARAPRSLVAIVDECMPIDGPDRPCAVGGAGALSGASMIASRRKAASGGQTLVSRASLRDDLLPLVSQEGQTFAELHAALVQKLAPTTLSLDTTPTLDGSFAFVPRGLFSSLPSDCNKVDVNADPVALKGFNLDPLQRACDVAVAQYPYARYFVDRQSAAREQRAYQRAVASCAVTVAISSFSTSYPASRFRRVVDDFSVDCARQRDDSQRQREAQDRDRVQREQAERDRLQQEQAQRDRQQQGDQAVVQVMQQIAQSFVARYYWVSSTAGESSGSRLNDVYAPAVNFYGRQRPIGDILNEKFTYNQRWPTRRFSIRPNSQSTCDRRTDSCRVSGYVEFDIESPARNARSRGLSSFTLDVANVSSNPRVVGEAATVEQRF